MGITNAYAYDQRGNLTEEWEDGNLLHRYTYGATNRLAKASDQAGREALYHYNGLDQRVGRSENGKETSYQAGREALYHYNGLGQRVGRSENGKERTGYLIRFRVFAYYTVQLCLYSDISVKKPACSPKLYRPQKGSVSGGSSQALAMRTHSRNSSGRPALGLPGL